MAGRTDVVKGRIEEAVGALMGNDKLREKCKRDQVAGEAKQAAAKVVGQANEVAQQAIDKATGTT